MDWKTFVRWAISFANFIVIGLWQKERVEAQFNLVRLKTCCAYSERSSGSLAPSRLTCTSIGRGVPKYRCRDGLGPVVANRKRFGATVTQVPRAAAPSPRGDLSNSRKELRSLI